MNGSCSHTELIFILLALTLFFTTQSKQSHHLESYLDSSSEYNTLTTFKLPYGNTTIYLQYIQHVQKIFHDLQEIFSQFHIAST